MKPFVLISLIMHLGFYFVGTKLDVIRSTQQAIEVQLTTFKAQAIVPVLSTQKQKLAKSISASASSVVSEESTSSLKIQYLSQVHELVKRQQIYPTLSKQLKEQGLVKVQLTIDSSGTLKKVELLEPSPFKRLNDAAMRAVSRAAPFQPFPPDVESESWKISIPVKFSLN